MDRAGLALAQLALAVAPHSSRVWVVCGPGNNGGDGLVAARYLKLWGKEPVVTHVPAQSAAPADAAWALQQAVDAHITFSDTPPNSYGVCIDALFGIGLTRNVNERYTALVTQMNAKLAPVIAADIPSGLNAETGAGHAPHVQANYTLSFLTLKPGLFTADGRDACGEIWLNTLGVTQTTEAAAACAQINAQPLARLRAHNTHKGTYGDVAIVGGAPGMLGGAVLAARAALHGGAGRVYLTPLDPHRPRLDILQPELMPRALKDLQYETMTVVAGCGGGTLIADHLDAILQRARCLVLDADALNAIASSPTLQSQLHKRSSNTTVLTPHPLEAARLLGISGGEVQSNRIAAAQTLATRLACTVVLKGSGTVIASPQQLPRINVTGNARLATAGTGDVLAGLIGAYLAAGQDPFSAACEGVYHHGQIADAWPCASTMTAQDLVHHL